MPAPVVVQTLGRGIEVTVEPPEQHSRQTQLAVAVRGQATVELPIVEAAKYRGANRARCDLQGPVARPEYLAEIGRIFSAERGIGLKGEAGFAGSALQSERVAALAVLDLCFRALGHRLSDTFIDLFVNTAPEGEGGCDVDVGPAPAMMHYCVSNEEAGGGIDL